MMRINLALAFLAVIAFILGGNLFPDPALPRDIAQVASAGSALSSSEEDRPSIEDEQGAPQMAARP